MKIKLLILSLFLSLAQIVSAQDNEDMKEDNRYAQSLDKIWELKDEYKRGNFKFSPYRRMYLIPIKITSAPNKRPVGFNPLRPVPSHKNYQNIESKFQVSMKTKIVEDLLFEGDLWLAFTQVAFWQVYNGDLSRPFRETNYEPEVIFTYPLRFSAGDFKMKMIGLSINHQSNGKEELNSRSWNRIILLSAFEYKNWVLQSRFWYRLPEKKENDDNPKITDYIGNGEISLVYSKNKHLFSLAHRNNFNFKHNRGYTELYYALPISGTLRGFVQFSHGYGESLIDYNHKQTTVSLGIVFWEL